MASSLDASVRAFLDRNSHATIATLDPDGAIHQVLVWYLRDGDEVIVNSARGRRWPANLLRDPSLSLVVVEGGAWVGLRGRATIVEDPARALADISTMARRYSPGDADERIRVFSTQRRISFRLAPDRVHDEL